MKKKKLSEAIRQFTKNLRKNHVFVVTKSIYATIPSYILVRFIPFLFLLMSGEINGAILYAKLSTMFDACKTIFEMFWAYGGYESYSSSRKRLNETFANLEKNTSLTIKGKNFPSKEPNIAFYNVSFSYPETNKKILENFSFTFENGKICNYWTKRDWKKHFI